jgi:hypothetical protein
MIPGSARNWIAVNAVQQFSVNNNMETKMTTMKLSLKLLATLISASFCLQASAATIAVTNTTDNDQGSLRQAIAAAASGDTINFDPTLNGQTITLTSGELGIGQNLTITGPGANLLAINGNANGRVFNIAPGADVTISGLTITNGSVPADNVGGGVFNDHATLTISSCTLSGNSAGAGGGIYNNGFNFGSATLTITNSTLSGNSANVGGGIYNAGIHFGSATLTVTNSTLSGNSANPGGGGVGGIFNNGSQGSATVEIGSTILNVGGGSGANITNFSGTITSDGYNLSSDAAGGDVTTGPGGFLNATGDQRNTNPLLGPLQDNGGPTFTHALLAGSPAINTGDPSFDPNAFDPPLLYDQRGSGFPRVANGRIDIGAFEVQPRCPHPQGYWKTNPALWPVTSLVLGSQTYSKTELLNILKTRVGSGPKADASLILADQLTAAKLNIANGSDPAPVSSTITHADSLLSAFGGNKLPYKVKTSSAIGQMMVNDGTTLGNYNNGLLTPVCSP